MVREPAQAVPASIAERLGKLRVLVVPYVLCLESGDAVSFAKPKGETHSAVWTETGGRTNLVLGSREPDPHDIVFEFLAIIPEPLRPKLSNQEVGRYPTLPRED